MLALRLLALAVTLAVHPQFASAQGRVTQTVRIRVALTVPRAAVLRSVVPAGVTLLADGRRQLTFDVTAGANCEWSLRVRRRAWWDRRAVDPIEVEREDGTWVPLGLSDDPVSVIERHPACNAETHTIRLRVTREAAEGLLDRLEFVVAPVER